MKILPCTWLINHRRRQLLTSPHLNPLYHNSLHNTVLYPTLLHHTIPHDTTPYHTAPHDTLPHITLLHHTSPQLNSPHLNSTRLTTPHLTAPHLYHDEIWVFGQHLLQIKAIERQHRDDVDAKQQRGSWEQLVEAVAVATPLQPAQ